MYTPAYLRNPRVSFRINNKYNNYNTLNEQKQNIFYLTKNKTLATAKWIGLQALNNNNNNNIKCY